MKKFGMNFIKDFDLFAKPFSFFVGDKKSKSTLIGGLLSLMVIGVSIFYFYYLMDLYFSNKIEPKITENFKIESNLNSIHIQESFIIMEMLINGIPLKQYEQQVNKVYLNYTVYYEQYFTNGTSQFNTLPISQCTDSNLTGYLCIDKSAFQQNLDIYNNPVTQLTSDYSIQINPCDNTTISNCATYEEINELIFQPQNYFQIFTKIKQYNTNTRQFEDGYKSEYIYFDPYLITYTRMDLIVATTTLTQGMVFQATTKSENIYNYQRVDTYFTKEGIQQRMGIDGFAYIVYELNQVHNYFEIQEPMITEILAQFMSIFNTLLIIGFVARLLAESHIVEDMNNILLKEYYKRTALRLVQRQQLKQVFQTIGKAEASAQAQIMQSFHSQSKVPTSKESQSDQQKQSKLFVEVNKTIAQTNFSEQLSKYFNLGLKDRVKHLICSIFARNHKVDDTKDPNSDPILYANLLKQSLKRINIFEVYKDLIKMKMAIKLIMTKEQYAAMQFCGSDMCSEEQEIQVMQNKEQSKIEENENIGSLKPSINNLNNSQKIFNAILSPDTKQSKKVLSTFSKEKNHQNSSEIIQKNKMSRFTINSNQNLIQNIQLQNQGVNNLFSNKNEYKTKHLTDSEMQSSVTKDIQTTNSTKNQVASFVNTLHLIQPQSPRKQMIKYDERDNIQNLKCFGDQNELDNDHLYSNTSLEEQQKIKEIFCKNGLQNLKSHLIEMDKIETDLQEKGLIVGVIMSSIVKNTIKSFDLFSKPFAFFVGTKKTKSTFVGGFLSLSVIAVSIVYFYYLMNLYFTNQIEPKITQSFQISSSMSTINIKDSFFAVEMLINGQPLKQYEKSVNQVYLNYTAQYEVYYPNGTSNTTIIQFQECTDQNFLGYQCIDLTAFQSSIDIFNNPTKQYSSDIAIQINYCDPIVTNNCASPDEISNLIFQQQNYFQVFTTIKQYNPNLRNYQASYKSEYFLFDPNLITYTRLDLILATTTINEGLLLQKQTTEVNIYDYQRVDTFFSQINIEQRMGISGLGYIVYELNQTHNTITIQNPMVTEILAQFMSIFNVLLLVGFLARYLAESYIVEDMNNILLQEYYKKTALKLVQKKEIKNAFQKYGNADAAAQSQLASSYNILNRLGNTKDLSAEKQKSKILCDIQKRINETDFSEQQKSYFEIGFKERFKNFFKKILGFNQKQDNQKDPNSDPILYDNLLKQSMKRINIFEVYKDLIKLKMAIKLILTKDQYAAIQFCGSDLCPVQTKTQSQIMQIQSSNQMGFIKSRYSKDLPAVVIEDQLLNSNDVNLLVQQQQTKIENLFFKDGIEKQIQSVNPTQKQNALTISQQKEDQQDQIIENFSSNQQQQIILNSSINDQYKFKSRMIQDIQQSLAVSKDEQLNIFETNDNLIKKQQNNIIHNSSPINNKYHKILIDKKDRIQSLRLNGDQSILDQSDLSIETPNTPQEGRNSPLSEGKNLQNLIGLNCHLVEMDKIEESEEERENYLKEFLVKMNNPDQCQINHVDQQIYQSLIINEKQVKAINNFFNQQVEINSRVSAPKKYQITNLMEELNNNKKQQDSLKDQ